MRSLADMTPQERAQCRGMWGQHGTGGLVIISTTDGIQSRGINVEIVRFLHDGRPIITWEPTNSITPRLDLPRAWQADGQPLEADWQYAEYQPGINRGFYTIEETIEKGPELAEGTTAARRWVGEWEEA